jgi:hypothetical protein
VTGSDFTQLRMPRQQRLAVGFLFGLGIIVTIAGIVRTWYIYRSLFNEWDQTWYSYPLWIAAAVEIDLGVVRHLFSNLRSEIDMSARYVHRRQYFGHCYRKYLPIFLRLSPAAKPPTSPPEPRRRTTPPHQNEEQTQYKEHRSWRRTGAEVTN